MEDRWGLLVFEKDDLFNTTQHNTIICWRYAHFKHINCDDNPQQQSSSDNCPEMRLMLVLVHSVTASRMMRRGKARQGKVVGNW